ncbi:MAG TPA: ribonuclease J [Anaerolineae bacterium]|nr:ribonuclease J [Anaerolineae bacterium]
MSEKILRIIPLGGIGQIGKNMTVFEYDDQLLIVDCGLMFPESDMLGIDIVIPDMNYVFERKDQVRAIIVTHGHEDHVGGLPYLLRQVRAPLYATRLTRGLIEVKLKEHHLLESADLHTITPRDTLDLDPFTVEFFHVCHSIPDGVGLGITTPVGLVVHSGDFKFDQTPVDGQLTDFAKLAELGGRGVMVLLSDSTNAEKEGHTPSEQVVGETFERVFARAKGRIIVATFASNISRVQQVVDTARQFGRRVGLVGRSMINYAKKAYELGYVDFAPGEMLTPQEMNELPPHKVAIACTGSQGEPTSALVRMALGEHRQVNIRHGDSVIVSATPIPGNEELVNRTINNLFRAGAEVYHHQRMQVHVSGHASREEHKLMLNLIRPRFFVPIHGEFRHLIHHARMAERVGVPPENIFIAESGTVLEFGGDWGRTNGQVTEGHVLVDGLGVGDVGSIVLRDRHLLSRDGFVVVVVAVDADSGQVIEGPDIITRGFVYIRESGDLIEDASRCVLDALKGGGPKATLNSKIKHSLAEFLYERTKRRPMILPVVMEI